MPFNKQPGHQQALSLAIWPGMSGSSSPEEEVQPSPGSPRTHPEKGKCGHSACKGSPRLDSIPEHIKSVAADDGGNGDLRSRNKSGSVSSISFKLDKDVSAPIRGKPKAHRKERIRSSSPPPQSRFRPHVSFDNFSGGEPTESNTIAFTLNVKHTGYQYKKRSRTFMVGIDENEYSKTALKWMLDELIDDGDEIVCVRVIDPDAKVVSSAKLETKQYQEEAQMLMRKIQQGNDSHRAISIVLEFAVGKLHTTFQKMINIYEPAMLIVGTKGRSLGGLQGLMTNRTSFSKWCLQYSPIPVVVVRPDEKRLKKKIKRSNDPERHNYKLILEKSGADVHETNAKPGGSFERVGSLTLSEDQEAHAVATALGLPGQLEPKTMQPIYVPGLEKPGRRDGEFPPGSPGVFVISPGTKLRTDSPSVSDEESDEEEDGEFEAVSGSSLIRSGTPGPNGDRVGLEEEAIMRKERLHKMEMGEANQLVRDREVRKASISSGEGADDEDEGYLYSPVQEERPFVEYFIV